MSECEMCKRLADRSDFWNAQYVKAEQQIEELQRQLAACRDLLMKKEAEVRRMNK